MKSAVLAQLFCVFCTPLGAVDLVLGHFEYQIDYEPNSENPDSGWRSSISYDLDGSFADDEGIVRLDESTVRLVAAPSTRVVTAEPPPEFGQANEPLWILSQNNVPGQLFLGWRAVYPQGIFQANVNGNYTPSPLGSISSELVEVTGSGIDRGGSFAMWTSSGFGALEFHFNSTDGITSNDVLNPIPAGSHSHYNWGFTKPGSYAVKFSNEGRLNPQFGSQDVTSEVSLNFVVPHDGFIDTAGHWRLGDGRENHPAAAIYDQTNQVDYAIDQVALIAKDNRFAMAMVAPTAESFGQVGLSGVDQINFQGEEPITIELIHQSGPGNVTISEAQGSTLFEFGADGIYRVTLQASQGEKTGPKFTLTFLSNLEADYSYEAWADSFERTHQLAAGALSDPQSNHDGDCLSNALEFLLFWHGFDPVAPDNHLMPTPQFVDGRAEIIFLRDLYKDDFASSALGLAAAYSPDLSTPWKPWHRLFSEGAADGFYEDGAELGNEISTIMRRRLVVPDASPTLGFFRFEQRSRN